MTLLYQGRSFFYRNYITALLFTKCLPEIIPLLDNLHYSFDLPGVLYGEQPVFHPPLYHLIWHKQFPGISFTCLFLSGIFFVDSISYGFDFFLQVPYWLPTCLQIKCYADLCDQIFRADRTLIFLCVHQPWFYPVVHPVHIFLHGFFHFWPDCFIDFK